MKQFVASAWTVVRVICLVGSVLAAAYSAAADDSDGRPGAAEGRSFFIAPGGSDSDPGSADRPWKSWEHALKQLHPGETLVVKDGTYSAATGAGFPYINGKSGYPSGTAEQPITVRAENERRALIDGDGTPTGGLIIVEVSHWFFEGLRIKGKDLRLSEGNHGVGVSLVRSNFVTLRRLLITHDNRYTNSHLLTVSGSSNVLVEECEFYDFHRHAINLHGSDHGIYRRNYANSRGYADLPDGRYSGDSERGDDAITVYPGSHNIFENNISEGNLCGISIMAVDRSENNRFLGNISLNDQYGIVMKARPEAGMSPRNNVVVNHVVINATAVGAYFRGVENTRWDNCTIAGGRHGVITDVETGAPGGGKYSFYSHNSLSVGTAGYGFALGYSDSAVAYAAAFQNKPDFHPAVPASQFSHTLSVDPGLGPCKLYIPAGSPLKRAGKDGADIGANVLDRYENGVLTDVPLWDRATGAFPHGAIVSGVNDIPGSSAFDVNRRLKVGPDTLPTDYAHPPGSNQKTRPSKP
jgi:hypothetical protein